MKKLFIFYDFFTPAFKGGGIIRSLDNLCKSLGEDFEVFLYTSHTDLHSSEPLPVERNQWVKYSPKVHVWYTKPKIMGFLQMRQLLNAIRPEVIYINGIFTPFFVLYPLLVRKSFNFSARWVIAPRGMLQQGALSVKSFKKHLYLKVFKILNLHREIHWHATDQQEILDINQIFPQAIIQLAFDTPQLDNPTFQSIQKNSGRVRLIFISLITAKKNIKSLFISLSQIPANIEITLEVYGPIKDKAYWEECQPVIAALPAHIQFIYHGEIKPIEVISSLQKAHFFVLPTLGENFGHSIFESFLAGRPVIITDRTPWRGIQTFPAGWDYPFEKTEILTELILKAAQMDQTNFDQYCKGAQQVAINYMQKNDFKAQYKTLFEY